MSYILEALKKAERQREIGQVPGIESSHDQTSLSASRRWFWLGVSALLINAVLLTLLLWPQTDAEKVVQSDTQQVPSSDRPQKPVPLPDQTTASPSAQIQPPERQPQPVARVPASPPPAPARPEQQVKAKVPPAPRTAQPSPAVAAAPTSQSPPLTPTKPVAQPKPVAQAKPVEPTKPVAQAKPMEQANAVASTGFPASEPQRAHPLGLTAKIEEPLLPVWPQIPNHLFTQLKGGLNLDVHVYSEHPEERFVLINLKKYLEGERLQEGPQVDAITPEGVVLSFKGQKFQVHAQ
jgi:general secretion pathway protein B